MGARYERESNLETTAYIDDRLLFGHDTKDMQRAWEQSKEWDEHNRWELNRKKTTFGRVGPKGAAREDNPDPNQPLMESASQRLLGQEIVARYNEGGTVIRDRRSAAHEAAEKVALLAAPIPVAQRLVAAVAIPKLLYGIFMQPPPKKLLSSMKAQIQRAEGLAGRAHSWEIINAVILKGHFHDPSIATARIITECVRALQQDVEARRVWQALSDEPLRPKPQGPRKTYLDTLARVGLFEESPWVLLDTKGRQLDFLNKDWREAKAFVKTSLRDFLLAQAEKKRKRFQGSTQSNPQVTSRYFRTKGVLRRQEATSIVCDALWTNRRKYVAGQKEEDKCSWCEGVVEDPEHVFYHCDRWEGCRHYIRKHADLLSDLPSSARQCGHAPADLPKELSAAWHYLLDEMAHIWSQRMQAEADSTEIEPPIEKKKGQPQRPGPPPEEGELMDFEIPGQLTGGFRPWPYSREAWHDVLRLLMCVRVGKDQDREPPTVLELYLQYILLFGVQFRDGLAHDGKEGWLGRQLASFTSALRSAQERLHVSLLQGGKQRYQVKAGWGAAYGFPPFPRLAIPLILPDHEEVWDLIEGAGTQMYESLETNAPQHAALWRRWRPAPKKAPKHPDPTGRPGQFELARLGSRTTGWSRDLRREQVWAREFQRTPEARVSLPWGGTVYEYVRETCHPTVRAQCTSTTAWVAYYGQLLARQSPM